MDTSKNIGTMATRSESSVDMIEDAFIDYITPKTLNTMKNTLKLYAVNYCDAKTLETQSFVKTHSEKHSKEVAKYLIKKDWVLYSQIVTYKYDEESETYIYINLDNYYKEDKI